MSAAGTAIDAADPRALGRIGRPDAAVSVLDTRNGRFYYRIGADCYGVGSGGPQAVQFGTIACSEEFPSAAEPLLDFTVLHHELSDGRKQGAGTVWRSEGIAADGVEFVAFRDSSGSLVGTTRVEGNVYAFRDIPPGGLSELVALDSSGHAIFSFALPQ